MPETQNTLPKMLAFSRSSRSSGPSAAMRASMACSIEMGSSTDDAPATSRRQGTTEVSRTPSAMHSRTHSSR